MASSRSIWAPLRDGKFGRYLVPGREFFEVQAAGKGIGNIVVIAVNNDAEGKLPGDGMRARIDWNMGAQHPALGVEDVVGGLKVDRLAVEQDGIARMAGDGDVARSEEHTSELQSRPHL